MQPGRLEEWWERDLGEPRWWARLILFAGIAGAIIGLIGFVSGTLLICLFNWTSLIVLGTTLAAIMLPRLIRLGLARGLPSGLAVGLAVALAAIPTATAIALFSAWAWPSEIGRSAADWYFKTVTAETLIVAAWAVLELVRQPVGSPALATSKQPTPPHASSDILCLQMEDHYVRIHREGGSTLELMPMTAAIDRLASADGLRVHRSWWVARRAVVRVERQGRNLRLVLANGLVVPVARNRVAAVRAFAL